MYSAIQNIKQLDIGNKLRKATKLDFFFRRDEEACDLHNRHYSADPLKLMFMAQ
jgi:hypothetical protein